MLSMGASLIVACSSETDYSNTLTEYKQQQNEQAFEKVFGNIAADQTWNTVVNLTANVKVDYEGTFSVRFYDADPSVQNGKATLLAAFDMGESKTGTYTFNAPNLKTVYAAIVDNSNMMFSQEVAVSGKTINANFGTLSQKKAMRKAASENYEKVEYMTFTKEQLQEVDELLPDGIEANGKMTDYEYKSTGNDIFVYPVGGSSKAHDRFGFYYYDPTDKANSFTKIVLIDDIHKLGERIQTITYNEDGTAAYSNYNYQPGESMDYDAITSEGFKINVPAGYNLGFWVSSEGYYTGSGQFYTSKALNSDGKQHSALVKTKDGTGFFGLEDQTNADFDCNDILFYVDPTDNVITPPDTTAMEAVTTIAFEDLGTSDDFDFNDIVVYVTHDYTNDSVKVQVVAAGGDLPIEVYYGDNMFYSKGKEGGLLNTGYGSTPSVLGEYKFKERNFDMTDANFYSKINVKVEQDGATYMLNCNTEAGKAPLALIIAGRWAWPVERTPIYDAYPQFKNWVSDTENSDWYYYPDKSKCVNVE